MKDRSTPKRSYFSAIVLILLVMSSIGNVALFTIKLQNSQQQVVNSGERIIHAAWDSKHHVELLLEAVTKLLESDDVGERIAAKQAIGFAFNYAEGLPDFTNAADQFHASKEIEGSRDVRQFISQVELSLRAIANHGGKLTDRERAYLLLVQDTYTKLAPLISQFDITETTRHNALRTANGGPWVEIAAQMRAVIAVPESVIIEGLPS
ncbi:hypothetical protein EBB07_33395 [Paenibacillaceae bacterium]|nr:hypothetical protein EBB07_33395 [Paenibacillaceae bacterium]